MFRPESLSAEARRRPYRRTAAVALLAIVAALALAACGGDDDDGGGETTEAATQTAPAGGGGETVDMSLTDFALNPAQVTVAPGEVTFNLTNDGQAPHNLEVEGPAGEAELDQDLEAGQSGQLTVDLNEPGTYTMYCPVGNHREMGMEGEVTVSG
jgi:plastocyanin